MTHFKAGDKVRLNDRFFDQAAPHSQRLRGAIGTVTQSFRWEQGRSVLVYVHGLSPTCGAWSYYYLSKVNPLGDFDNKEIRL